jgi:hypothetical protein
MTIDFRLDISISTYLAINLKARTAKQLPAWSAEHFAVLWTPSYHRRRKARAPAKALVDVDGDSGTDEDVGLQAEVGVRDDGPVYRPETEDGQPRVGVLHRVLIVL